MPYRRLPTTDQTRLHALQRAVQKANEADFTDQVISYKTLSEAQRFLMIFENQVSQYHSNFQNKVSANKQYRHVTSKARMYISHFIQVLNMSVIRGEIKKDFKTLYGLEPNEHTLPDLSTDDALLEWGKKIIQGEEERIRQGGFPIYNPNITKVKVYYDMFCEQHSYQDMHKKNTSRVYEDLGDLRRQADEIILDIWNTVEAHYKDLLPYARLMACKSYGLIYYYRTGEKKLTPETDQEIIRIHRMQPELPNLM
ncbi:MAG: hypothetical protein IKO66_03800 [Paludibacteraceae bacterium]|nr:hypothetical protein [Paludibacteraceae bacterium]